MSSTFTLYVVDENSLPVTLPGATDRQRYDKLVRDVKAKGAKWASLELSTADFARALERIDEEMGGTRFLPAYAFNNSPHNLLGNDGACPCFGYFYPEQAHVLQECIRDITSEVIAQSNDETAESVFHAFQSTAEEAVRRGGALAVLHDE